MLELVAVLAVESADETQEFRTRQLLVNEWPVGNESQLCFRGERILSEIDSRQVDRTGCRLENSRDHPQRCRLPGAVWPQKPKQFSVGHGQIDRIDGCVLAVFLGQT